MDMMQNTYSRRWFEVFGGAVDINQTTREVDFLCRQLPRPRFRDILDVCCGVGRHAIALASHGYSVTGIDIDEGALRDARVGSRANVDFRRVDMLALHTLPSDYRAVLCMWQSFGQFDDQTNARVLKGMADRLNHHGRIALDVYHRPFFETHQGMRTLTHGAAPVIEIKTMIGDRLRVHLDYGDGASDCFEWRLYNFDEWRELAASINARVIVNCAVFDESIAPSADQPRMQLVLERQ